ncbi:unnamed protein product [Brassica oleracea]
MVLSVCLKMIFSGRRCAEALGCLSSGRLFPMWC